MEIVDFAIIIGFTTVITTASTTVIIYNQRQALESAICGNITTLHNRLNDVLIRLGIVENKHDDKYSI